VSGWGKPAGGATWHHDPRRLGLATAVVVIGYALFLGAIAAGVVPIPASTYGDPGPRHSLYGIWLAISLAVPGVVAAIGASRRSGPLLVAAGVMCVAQSLIAISGAALPFVVPAVYLIVLGTNTRPRVTSRREVFVGIGIVVVVAANWLVRFSLTETQCWTATEGPAGDLIYTDAPESATQVLDDVIVAAGCQGGTPTPVGIAVSSMFLGSAVGLALWGSRRDGGRQIEATA
jgi:hypothetical protein